MLSDRRINTLIIARRISIPCILTSLVVDIFKIKGMDMTREISQDGKEDVDAQVNSASLD